MPNEVYEAAVEGLSSLVSPRVAKRIIDDSLRATSRTAEDVSSTAMRRLLLGRVRSELEGVMPAAAVGPGLVQLAEELHSSRSRGRRPWWRRAGRERRSQAAVAERDSASTTRGANTPQKSQESTPWAHGERQGSTQPKQRRQQPRHEVPHELVITKPEQVGVTRSSVYLPGVDLGMEPITGRSAGPNSAVITAVDHVAAGSGSASASSSSATSSSAVGEKTAVVVAPQALPALTTRLIERALRVFADLETVRQIVAVQRGEVVQASGTGLDAEKLKGLSVATTALLSKAGTLRVFSLEHEAGVLFLFPLRDGALVVLTQPKVNIGAVLSARAALEEAA